MLFILLLLLLSTANAIKYCSGHDGCKNLVLNDNDLRCSGGERCCKNVNMYCTSGSTCSVYIGGGGHDQFQDSEVFAQEAASFELSCLASGLRECQNTKIFCPMGQNAVCKCTNCPSSAKMYCPPGASCTAGGATLVNMNEYICKGSGSQVYCEDPTYSIDFCSNTVDSNCISVISQQTYVAARCKNTAGQYKRPKCPQYYQGKADNIVYHNVTRYINVTINEDAALPLEQLCKASVPPKDTLARPRTRGFQINSWNTGCEKKKPTLDQCKSACASPQGCCGSTCAWNSCSGGSCCAASRDICQKACNFMFDPQVYNIIPYINVTNVTRFINRTVLQYLNRTRYINVTRFINQTRYVNVNRYINRTTYVNRTVIRYVNINKYENGSAHVQSYDVEVDRPQTDSGFSLHEIVFIGILCLAFFLVGAYVAYILYDSIKQALDCLFCI